MKIRNVLWLLLFISSACVAQKANPECLINTRFSNVELPFELLACNSAAIESFHLTKIDSNFYGYEVAIYNEAAEITDEIYDKRAIELNIYNYQQLEFSKFKNLEYLSINRVNRLNEGIRELKDLKVLLIGDGELMGIPDWISEFKGLEVFVIKQGLRLKKIPDAIHELANLKEINVYGFFEDQEPLNFERFPRLEVFKASLYSDRFINQSIVQCKELRYLDSNKIYEYFSELEKLESLSVGFFYSSIEKLQILSGLPNFRELSVTNLMKFDKISEALNVLPDLKNLIVQPIDLMEQKDGGFQIEHPSLEYLEIQGRYLRSFPKLNTPKLRCITIFNNLPQGNIVLPINLLNFKELKYVNVVGKSIGGSEIDLTEAQFKLIDSIDEKLKGTGRGGILNTMYPR